MEIEKITGILIFAHAFFGSLALISGAISLLVKKGNRIHKKAGKVFYYTMLFSAVLALIISMMPNHHNSFLFCIGLFSSYFIIGGNRSLSFNKENKSFLIDKIIAYLIILIGITMISYPIILNGEVRTVLLVFGIISIVFGTIDLFLFNNPDRTKRNWLKIHLSKMISGYVAAFTAFVVVNQFIPGIWAWFTPGIFGIVYLIFWMNKLKNN